MIRKEHMILTYSHIAIHHYWNAKQCYERLSCLKYITDDSLHSEKALVESSIIAVTFSAMALEAFMNDYAAINLGDKLYYENFDILRPIGKLQLISQFILKSDIHKGSQLFNLVDSLFKKRNYYVHSKSKDASSYGMSEDEYQEYRKFLETEEGEEFLCRVPEIDITTSKEMLHNAFNALCALREVGRFFDKHDPQSFALANLLMVKMHVPFSSEEIACIKEVQNELSVPLVP